MDAPTRDAGFFTETLETRDPELFGSITDHYMVCRVGHEGTRSSVSNTSCLSGRSDT